MNTRGAKLRDFIDVLKRNGYKTFSDLQLRRGIKQYFGIRDRLVSEYIGDLHKLGLIEEGEQHSWRLKKDMASSAAKAGQAKQCVGEKNS